MAPGISQMDEVPEGGAVSIFADGKKYALAIGVLLKNSDDILADKKGPSVEARKKKLFWKINADSALQMSGKGDVCGKLSVIT